MLQTGMLPRLHLMVSKVQRLQAQLQAIHDLQIHYLSRYHLNIPLRNRVRPDLPAAIPYLPPKGQQIFSVYEKAVEFINTVSVFSKRSSGSDLCAMSMPSQNPVDIINDIRSFCYGPSRDKLDQMVNMMAMVQMLQLMNQPADGEKEDSHE